MVITKPQQLGKQAILDHWDGLSEDQPIAMSPLESNHKGSSYDQDSIRITGSQEFIDGCLSRLKSLMQYEEGSTLLQISYQQTVERVHGPDGKPITTGELTGAWAFYVKARMRGTKRSGPKRGPRKPKSEPEIHPYKVVNAGLNLKAKPQNGVKKIRISEDNARFAIGVPDEDEPSGYAWCEPEDHTTTGTPCTTYEDAELADGVLRKFQKSDKKFRGEIIPVWHDRQGELQCGGSMRKG
jgi:hypothetical protein